MLFLMILPILLTVCGIVLILAGIITPLPLLIGATLGALFIFAGIFAAFEIKGRK